MQIRITSTPPGDAPENIRKEWIGLVLPVSEKYARLNRVPMAGVLSGPTTLIGKLLGLFTGEITMDDGFVVHAATAVDILAGKSPMAADWWRKNLPHMMRPGKHFVFSRDACEIEPEPEDEIISS